MVFLVLDHDQPNPLFRAPIGDSPKVNKSSKKSSLKVSLIIQHSTFWTSELDKAVGQCKYKSLNPPFSPEKY